MTKNFTHLHVHDYYSMLDGFGSPDANAKRAKELGMTHLAQTNHNLLTGVVEFQKACNNEGIMPILGVESYFSYETKEIILDAKERTKIAIERAAKDDIVIDPKAKKKDIKHLLEPYECDTKQYHLILLAKNQIGWQNLVKIQSIASEECTFNGRYLVSIELLEEYSEGIVCSSACFGSYSARMINQNKLEEAEKNIKDLHRIFKDNFYLEIQPLNIKEQRKVNLQYIKWAKEKSIKLISTTDQHYTNMEDHNDHDTLMCIGMGKSKADPARMKYSNDYWMRSYDEMLEAYNIQIEDTNLIGISREDYLEIIKESLDNTNLIASQVEHIELGSKTDQFADINIPHGLSPEEQLRMLAHTNLYKYKNNNPEIDLLTYEKRIDEELQVINTKGYAPYFLIVLDYINWANNNGVPTGPSRGSAGSCLVAFLVGITKVIDPIKNNLLFFRFLTKDRTSPPDIDCAA